MTAPTPTPLLSALIKAAQREHAAFYAPGHKQGQGISRLLAALLGEQVFRADLPELPELDNLFSPAGPIQQAQQLAAETFGAEATFFLANGSTCGIEAAILATCLPGDKVLVPRNAHRSVLSALILSGAHPVYLAPIYDARWDLAYGVTPEQVELALAKHPSIRAVVVVSPSYHGVCTDIAAIAARVHQRSGILIVDEAHGPHLSFHEQLPMGAIAGGADLVIQSTHKVLAALTQASMLHVQGPRVDRDRLRQALQITQSTSPNYLLLASLDAARQQMAVEGHALMDQTLRIAQQVRSQLTALAPLQTLDSEHVSPLSSGFQLDLTRLTVDVSALGITGFAADELLHEQLGATAELPTLRQLTFILSLGNIPADGDRLVSALKALIAKATLDPQPLVAIAADEPLPAPALTEPPLSPRDAFFAPSQTVAITQAAGHLSADILCPYPPGIPVLLPGERITPEAIAYLQHIQAAGGMITGGPDSGLQALRIVDTRSNR
ncbi:MAG: aminotransferase class I/II-fold pyridoxal phosphate-dependent enzyme [Leptolyngbyaceae cyanobacterium]